jgi:hypothetical protein
MKAGRHMQTLSQTKTANVNIFGTIKGGNMEAIDLSEPTGFMDILTGGKKPYKKKTPKPQRIRHNKVKNLKQAEHVRMMAEKWKPSTVHKKEPDIFSLTSLKKKWGCTRHIARLRRKEVKAKMEAEAKRKRGKDGRV